jgi:hypothetical protein
MQTRPDTAQLLASLGYFKDWTNYLLVTSVAALGWVAKGDALVTGWALTCTISFLCVSIVFAILTLAVIPLVGERLRDGISIYSTRATFKLLWLWGPEFSAGLKSFCWPQHVFFLAAVIVFSAGSIRTAAWKAAGG